jgi:ribosome-binding protein aMBF1 (putative translation factor)
MSFEHQNWDTIYVHLDKHKSKEKNSSTKTHKEVSKETKIEQQIEDGKLSHKKISTDFGKQVQSYRLQHKLTQKDLSQKINQPVKIITEIENGTAKHNPQVISKLKRLLCK